MNTNSESLVHISFVVKIVELYKSNLILFSISLTSLTSLTSEIENSRSKTSCEMTLVEAFIPP